MFEYIHPEAIETEPTRPNEIGMHRAARARLTAVDSCARPVTVTSPSRFTTRAPELALDQLHSVTEAASEPVGIDSWWSPRRFELLSRPRSNTATAMAASTATPDAL